MNPKRGAVPFPIAGKGAYLRFDLDALATLEGELGEEWWMGVLTSLDRGVLSLAAPAKLSKRLLEISLFNKDGVQIGPEALGEQPLRVAYQPLRDALAQAVNGTDYATAIDEITKRAADAEAGGQGPENPQKPKPEGSSTTSADAPTE